MVLDKPRQKHLQDPNSKEEAGLHDVHLSTGSMQKEGPGQKSKKPYLKSKQSKVVELSPA
jgi:hypothetical protein